MRPPYFQYAVKQVWAPGVNRHQWAVVNCQTGIAQSVWPLRLDAATTMMRLNKG